MCAFRNQSDGQRLNGDTDVDCRASTQPHRVTSDFDGFETPQDLTDHHLEFRSGETSAQAEVRPPAAEGDVGIWRSSNIELVRIVEDPIVPVCRRLEERYAIARAQLLATEFDVAGHRPTKADDGTRPSEDLLGGLRKHRGVLA